jgi:hypothetical protein
LLLAWIAVACAPAPAATTSGGFAIVLDVVADSSAKDGQSVDVAATDATPATRRQGDDGEPSEATEPDTAVGPDGSEGLEDAAPLEDAPTVADTTDVAGDTSKADIYKPDVVLADIKADAKADSKPSDGGASAVTFAQLWSGPLKSAGCLSPACHGTLFANQAEGLKNLLSGKGEGDCAGKPLVVPGDPVASLLWQKVQPGLATCGLKMPPGAPSPGGMSDKDAALIEAWIQGGAKP